MFCRCCFRFIFFFFLANVLAYDENTEHIKFWTRRGRKKHHNWTLKYSEESAFVQNWKKRERITEFAVFAVRLVLFFFFFAWPSVAVIQRPDWKKNECKKYIYQIWKLSLTCLCVCVNVLVCLFACLICLCVCTMRASFYSSKIFIQRLAFIGRCRPFQINLEISYTENILDFDLLLFLLASNIYSIQHFVWTRK